MPLFETLVHDAGEARAFVETNPDMGHLDDSLRGFVEGTWVGEWTEDFFRQFTSALLASLRDTPNEEAAAIAQRHGIDPAAFVTAHREFLDTILSSRPG